MVSESESKKVSKKRRAKKREEYYDPHIGCFSYPNCDEAPNGCYVRMGKDVEPYGHRD